jgi:alpha-amylase/alpha-mannosidase (GH57 family)
MQPVSMALFWHQHQPYYPDDVSGETLMPWVRMHGTKDYIGMALHVAEVPEFRCTINLVPSLLVQIQRYVDGKSDRHLDVSRLPVDGLSEVDEQYLLDNFFMAYVDGMIRPHARYFELYQKRNLGRESAQAVRSRFSSQDLRDLQVWSNLTWFHELLFERDVELRDFRTKGGGWSEDEKQWLLHKQREILAEIVPLHRKLAEGGQLELTTTPFYHPIMPLLWDKRSARQAMPGCELPKHLESYKEDVALHLERAVALHEKLFGAKPTGMWPSEGSVSQEIVGAIADVGIQWIATDEEILMNSTDGYISRDGQGLVTRPDMLFRPWRVEQDGKQLQMVFRDHGLSDLIGFHYQRNDPVWAADDLIGKVASIGRGVSGRMGDKPAIVPIILDGENCWEFYPDGGVRFLRHLYRQSASNPNVKPMRICDHLEKYPATDRIAKLFAGSWISHNFAIWIGHEEDRTAWDMLHPTREYLKKASENPKIPKETLEKAWSELMIAEGSDWYWWFGGEFSSAQDALFDLLFRRHLQNVYTLLGESPPPQLMRPIKRIAQRIIHTQPRSFLNVKLDGRQSFFEWLNAGSYKSGQERGTMAQVTEGVIRQVQFGFDRDRLLIRLDTANAAREDLTAVDEVRLRFIEPQNVEVRLMNPSAATPQVRVHRDGQRVPRSKASAAVHEILECAIPLSELAITPGSPCHWSIELFAQKQSKERIPAEGAFELAVPAADFEQRVWQA